MIEIGASIGRYHILEQLGQGGMATVYRAFDTRLDNEVALKILRVDIFGPAVLERLAKRFEREAKLMAGMSHRGIVKVFDYGEYNGAPYLVMELLPGGTLKDRMGKPFPYAEAARLTAQVAHALNYAHQRKHPILHRDVKPANILVNEGGELVLTDFGIAKVLAESEGNSLTGTGVGIGTPEYMAPEQGLGKEVDGRADVYALGVVFYELITGRKPFTADTPMAVILKHVTDPLPRPKEFVPNLPDQVEQVLFKTLAKKPEDRYQSMQEMAAAMERLITDTRPAPTESAGIPTKPEYSATDDTETGEITHDFGEGAQAASPEPVPPVIARDFSTTDQIPDPDISTIKENGQSLPDKAPRQARRRIKPWQGMALAAVLMMAAIGIIIASISTPDAVPETITPVLPTVTTGPDTPTPRPSPEVTATIESPAAPIPFGAEIMRLGEGILSEIVYSPDGKTLAAASSIGIQFYDAGTLEKKGFIDTRSWMSSIAFSPDGVMLAAGSSEGIIQLYDAGSGALVKTLEGHTSGVLSVAFSPDGKMLASGAGSWSQSYEDNSIRLWNVDSGALLHTLEGHTSEVTSLSFSPDGSRLVSSSWGGSIKLWDAEGGGLLTTLDPGGGVSCVAFSPDGRRLASGSFSGQVKLWEAESGRLLRYLVNYHNSNPTFSIAFSPDGKWLAAGSSDGTIHLSGVYEYSEPQILTDHSSDVTSIAFSPDGLHFVSASPVTSIKLWDAQNGVLEQTLEGHTHSDGVESVAFSPDEGRLASGSSDDTIKLWDPESGALLQTLEGHTGNVNSIAFAPDGRRLASGSSDDTIKLWDVDSGKLQKTLEGHTGGVLSVAYSPGGDTLASGSWDKDLRLWDAESGKWMKSFFHQWGYVSSVAFAPDGQRLASGSSDDTVKLWDPESFARIQTIYTNGMDVNCVAFSSDGRTLAGSVGNTIRLWDVESGNLLLTLEGHTNGVTSIAFSPDGLYLASGSADKTIRLWDAQSGELLQTLEGHTDIVRSVAFSPDGRTLASGSEDGTIRIWDISEE